MNTEISGYNGQAVTTWGRDLEGDVYISPSKPMTTTVSCGACGKKVTIPGFSWRREIEKKGWVPNYPSGEYFCSLECSGVPNVPEGFTLPLEFEDKELQTLLSAVSGTSLEGPIKERLQQSLNDFLVKRDLAQREAALRVGQLSLAQLIEELENLPSEAEDYPVSVQDSYRRTCFIDGYGSYRGFYSEMALESSYAPSHTLSSLLKLLKGSLGGCLFGYKGGNFPITGETPVWVSDYGVSSGIMVTGVVLDTEGNTVKITVRKRETD